MPFTYLLRCADGSFYVGSTRNIQTRLAQHATGAGSRFTATRLPVELVWTEEFQRMDDAWAAERRIHGWSRAKREALVSGDWLELKRLSKGRGGS